MYMFFNFVNNNERRWCSEGDLLLFCFTLNSWIVKTIPTSSNWVMHWNKFILFPNMKDKEPNETMMDMAT